MTETRTCTRCLREGTREFQRVSNAATGEAEWRCRNTMACTERTWRQVPCDHNDDHVGRVQAGELVLGKRHCSVYTCHACVPASREYVTRVTGGLPASDLILFEESAGGAE